jgi:hypothetical protein
MEARQGPSRSPVACLIGHTDSPQTNKRQPSYATNVRDGDQTNDRRRSFMLC